MPARAPFLVSERKQKVRRSRIKIGNRRFWIWISICSDFRLPDPQRGETNARVDSSTCHIGDLFGNGSPGARSSGSAVKSDRVDGDPRRSRADLPHEASRRHERRLDAPRHVRSSRNPPEIRSIRVYASASWTGEKTPRVQSRRRLPRGASDDRTNRGEGEGDGEGDGEDGEDGRATLESGRVSRPAFRREIEKSGLARGRARAREGTDRDRFEAGCSRQAGSLGRTAGTRDNRVSETRVGDRPLQLATRGGISDI